MAGELETALLGASAGETKQVSFALADGTTSTVEITVREVQEKVLPPLDDDLARAERVRHARRVARVSRARFGSSSTPRSTRRSACGGGRTRACIAGATCSSAHSHRAADLLTGFARSLERRGSRSRRTSPSGGSAEELQRQMVLEAAVSISRELALEALAERAGIEVSDDEVKAYLREEAESAGEEDPDGLVEDVWAHGQQESIREDLRLRAALDRLVADVKPIAPTSRPRETSSDT